MKDLMIIFDSDAKYVERLKEAFNSDEEFPFYAVVVKNETELTEFLSDQDAKVILTSEKNITVDRAETVIRMSGVPDVSGTIYKYQTIGTIKKEILKRWQAEENREAMGTAGGKSVYIGVASPVGRSLKTSFALVLGQLLAQRGKTLYVNLEPCPGLSVLFGKKFTYDLSDLLYAASKEEWEDFRTIEEENRGLFIFPPAAVPEDVYETDPELLKTVIRKYVEVNGHETVILDLGTEYRIKEALIPLLNKLYIPTKKGALQEAKTNEFREWLARVTEPAFEERAEIITLPAPGLFSKGNMDTEQLLFTELGDYVRIMLGGIIS